MQTHKDYAGCIPIQISVYPDKIMMWNMGRLPENWTIDTFQEKHLSIPHNPDIANAFFRSSYVEAWGRGVEKITDLCTAAGLPAPLFASKGNDFWLTFRKDIYNKEDLSKLRLNERQIKAVLYVKEKGKITNSEYQALNSIEKSITIDELRGLTEKQMLSKVGETGRNAYYELYNTNKRPINDRILSNILHQLHLGSFLSSTRYRNPLAKRALRNVNSGFVSFDPIIDITSDRFFLS